MKPKIRTSPKTIIVLLIFAFCVACMIAEQNRPVKEENSEEIFHEMFRGIAQICLPTFGFVDNAGEQNGFSEGLRQWLLCRCPLYAYSREHTDTLLVYEDSFTEKMILENEGKDEFYDVVDTKAFLEENASAVPLTENPVQNEVASSLPETDFFEVKEKQMEYVKKDLYQFDFLMDQFYLVDATTKANRKLLNGDELLSYDMTLNPQNKEYQILIYHTHSQEAFCDSIPGDPETSVVGAGRYLTKLLEENYGFHVLHHEGTYDVESRDYAYSNAAPAVEQILKEHPEIEVIIDLHRDGVDEQSHLVTNLNGRNTAQLMFFNGLSYTNAIGDIPYLKNPYLKENLAFSLQMQIAANEYYPGLTRKIYLKGYRYNMHYRPKTLLVEMGAQTNTFQEIKNACDPFAHVLSLVLKPESEE